ncbi:hypothetical protein ACO2Q2_16925 [Dyella sp. KRB-257]|uniref:hypothetical protein n=1 Tax=Dyella sp. KRB-257 TaxID=3400915 RepID=UPI003C10DD4A
MRAASGLEVITRGLDHFLKPTSSKRQHDSILRIGKEFILHGCTGLSLHQIRPPDLPADAISPPLNRQK